jgi:hypothetical protein
MYNLNMRIIYYILFVIIFVLVAHISQIKKERYINYECEEIEPESSSDPIDCKGKGTLEKVVVEKKKGKDGLPDIKIRYKCCFPEKNQICINDSCIQEKKWKSLTLFDTQSMTDEIIKLKSDFDKLKTDVDTKLKSTVAPVAPAKK